MTAKAEKMFYSSADIAGIHFTIIASAKGISALRINSDDTPPSPEYTRLQNNDPWFFDITSQLEEYFSRNRKEFSIPLDLHGTDFQKKVWNELLKIPFGSTISYHTLSEKIGNTKAIRAAGRAAGANPVPVIIPCHRVINSDGSLGGFSCGPEIKQKLLELEGKLSLQLFD